MNAKLCPNLCLLCLICMHYFYLGSFDNRNKYCILLLHWPTTLPYNPTTSKLQLGPGFRFFSADQAFDFPERTRVSVFQCGPGFRFFSAGQNLQALTCSNLSFCLLLPFLIIFISHLLEQVHSFKFVQF